MRTLRLPWAPRPLGCPELVELVTDYFEGALSARDERRVDAHLAACDGCEIYVEQLRAVHAQLGRLTPQDLPPQTEQALRHIFQDWSAS